MRVTSTIFILASLSFVCMLFLGNAGGAPTGRTGAPGDLTCATAGCHEGTVNQGDATISITLADEATHYEPGVENTINISISNSQNENKNGFEIVALNASGANFGTWQLINAAETQIQSGSNGRQYVTHTTTGNTKSTWQVNWEAPENATDTVFFYLAVNDANNDGGSTGDMIYTTSSSIAPRSVTNLPVLETSLVRVFPNPVSNTLNIESSNLIINSTTLFNSQGQTIAHQFSGQKQVHFDGLPAGTYFLRLITPDGQITKQIQKID